MRVCLSILAPELSSFSKACNKLGVDITIGSHQPSDFICLATIEEEDWNFLRLALPQLYITPARNGFIIGYQNSTVRNNFPHESLYD